MTWFGGLVFYGALVQCSTVQVTQRPAEASIPIPFRPSRQTSRHKSLGAQGEQGEQGSVARRCLCGLGPPLFLLSCPSLARGRRHCRGRRCRLPWVWRACAFTTYATDLEVQGSSGPRATQTPDLLVTLHSEHSQSIPWFHISQVLLLQWRSWKIFEWIEVAICRLRPVGMPWDLQGGSTKRHSRYIAIQPFAAVALFHPVISSEHTSEHHIRLRSGISSGNVWKVRSVVRKEIMSFSAILVSFMFLSCSIYFYITYI